MSASHSLGHCIHYNPDGRFGVGGKKASGLCDAGIAYDSVRIEPAIRGKGLPVVLPCTADARDYGTAATCRSRCYPTAEQVKAADEELERAVVAIEKGLCPECGSKLIRKSHGRSGGYTARCPKCPDVSVRACGRGR